MSESKNKKELERKIDQYTNGQLSAGEVDELWAELIQDDMNIDFLKTSANLKEVVKQKQEKKQQKERQRYWYYAAAAAVALLIGIMSYMNFAYDGATSVQPIDQIELDYYRSAENPTSEGGSELIGRAITLANTGNITEAINLLQKELTTATSPEWVARLNLNLGSLYYNQSQYRNAIKHYNNVIDQREHIDVLMLEKAYWYVGNAYFHTDHLNEARANIEKAYNLNGAYRRVTESYLEALS